MNGTYNVINGNHRVEAIRRAIQINPNFSIVVTLTKYDNLPEDEELVLYEIINKTKAETRMDRLKAHCIDSWIIKQMKKDFSFKISFHPPGIKERNTVSVSRILEPYINRDKERIVGDITTDKMVEIINLMNEDDLDKLARFANFFKRTFGEPGKGNRYSDYNFFSIVIKIYFTESSVGIGEQELTRRFKEMTTRFASQLDHLFTYGKGYKQIHLLYYDVLRLLNMCKLPGHQKDVFNLIEQIRKQRQQKEQEIVI